YWCEPGARPLFLDLRVPRRDDTGELPPVVLWLHGGGWRQGSRRRQSPGAHRHWLIERAVMAGFAMALVDYRLAPEGTFPAPVADVRAAIRWLRAHADDLEIDAGRVALWGESAGGHIACMAASCDRDLGDRCEGGENLEQPEY